MIRMAPPLHDWHRYHPSARAIAAELLAQPAVLNLRTCRLVSDIRQRFRVGRSTAMTAVSFARKAA